MICKVNFLPSFGLLYCIILAGAVDSEAVALLQALKEEVHQIMPAENIYSFEVDWPNRVKDETDANFYTDTMLNDIADTFCRKVQ